MEGEGGYTRGEGVPEDRWETREGEGYTGQVGGSYIRQGERATQNM